MPRRLPSYLSGHSLSIRQPPQLPNPYAIEKRPEMQAIREKFDDMTTTRKVKNEAREEEKAEKELAKVRLQVAHEVRMAKEAEAAMDFHVNKAADKVAEQERKHNQSSGRRNYEYMSYVRQDSIGRNPNSPPVAYSNDPAFATSSGGSPAAGYSSDPTSGGAASKDPKYGRSDSVRSATETEYADCKSTL